MIAKAAMFRLPLALAALALLAGCNKEPAAPAVKPPSPPVPVTVATVVKKTMPVEIRTFGTGEANLTVAVKSQITGILQKIHFKEGQDVKAGDLLFTIDPEPLKAALVQAEANLARDMAQQKNAEKEAERQQALLKKGFASEDEYDAARTSADALKAVLRAGTAAIDTARIQLSYCTITSPIDGRMGQWMVDAGNLVKADDVTMVVIHQVRPIQLSFSVPQQDLPAIQKRMAKAKLQVRATVPGDEEQPEIGELTFLDNTVDRTTGMIRLKATFSNTGNRLWPGQYVDVVLVVDEESNAIVVPARTIQTGQKGDYVYVVKPDKSVDVRLVTVKRSLDNETIVSAGLQEGETVVTDGQLRLAAGSKVVVKDGLGKAEKNGPPAEKSKDLPAEAPLGTGKAAPQDAPKEKSADAPKAPGRGGKAGGEASRS